MKENATLDKIEAAIDAFSSERLRWLVGKGDILIQEGELKKDRLDELLEKTVRDEIERSFILKQLKDAPKTVYEIAKATKMKTDRILWNILAMMKWNLTEIKGEKKREYIYCIKEV